MNLDNDPARAALDYAKRGWQVLPLWWPVRMGGCACGLPDCDSVGKHPISRLVPHGLYDASCQLGTVAGWWRSLPRANVGIRTGSESGLVVIDVDGRAGVQALRAMIIARGPLSARWARTGGGGWHAYLSHPGSIVPSTAGRIGESLDVRADGGYVVAPPSRHWTGRLYRWAVSPDCALHADHPAPMPRWLLELATLPAWRHSEVAPVRLSAVLASAYAAAAVEREADEVAHAPVGQRNYRLCADLWVMPTSALETGPRELREAPKTSA